MGRGQAEVRLTPFGRTLMGLRAVLFLFALVGVAGAFPGPADAQAQPSDPVQLEWNGKVHRLGGPTRVELSTRQENLVKELKATHVIVKCSDGRERRLRSSAKTGKVRSDSGKHLLEVDVSELETQPPPGPFEVAFELPNGQRTQPLHGLWVKPLQDPKGDLTRRPDKLAALIETDLGNMLFELRADAAPKTVANFVKLASEGFYDGTVFHRIYRGFVLQGGGVKSDGTPVASDRIPFEASSLPHDRGVISMARVGDDLASASCQFFICLVSNRNALDGKYASFGKLVEGYGAEAMDRLALTPVTVGSDGKERSKPLEPPVLRKVSIVEKP